MEKGSQENNKRIAKNTLYMYLRMLVMLVVSLFTTRIVFNELGVDNYGIYNIVGSIIIFFTFLNNGLTTATRRYITAELATGDKESQTNVFNLAILSHTLISLVVLIIAETLGLWAINNFLNIPSDRMFAANIVYQASVITAIFGIFQAPYTAAITAHEKMSIYAYFSIFEVLLKLFVVFMIQWIEADKLIVYAILMLFIGIVNQTIYRLYCHRKFAECKFQKPHNKALLKEMFGFMGWSLAGQGVVVMTNQGVTVLVNMFFNVAANAAMGVSNQITNIVTGFVTNFQTAFMPQITKQYVKGEYENMTKLAIRSSRMSSYLVLIFLLPIICQIDNFLSLWLGDYPQYTVEFCILTLIGLLIDAMSAPLWMILGSDKNIKKYQIVISSIYALNFIGAWGLFALGYPPYTAIMVRTVVYIVSTIARLKLVIEKVPSFPFAGWICDVWINSIKVLAIPSIVMYAIMKCTIQNVFAELFVYGGLAGLLMCASIYAFGLTKNERSFVIEKLVSKIHK